MRHTKQFLYVLTLTSSAAMAQSSSSSYSSCGVDHLPPHMVMNSRSLHADLLKTKTEIQNFAVAKNSGETWQEVAQRLDARVIWFKKLGLYNGCQVTSDCKVLNFPSFDANSETLGGDVIFQGLLGISNIKAAPNRMKFAFSSYYDLNYNGKTSIALLQESHALYVAKLQQIYDAAVADGETELFTYQSTSVYPGDIVSVCVNNACQLGKAGPFSYNAGSTAPRAVNGNDGIYSYTVYVPSNYQSPKINVTP